MVLTMKLSRRATQCSALFLGGLLISFAPVASLFFDNHRMVWNQDEHHIAMPSGPDTRRTGNFSVGFSLQSSYGTAVVMFDHLDGTHNAFVRTIEGDAPYRKIIAKLSRESSQHLAPPYQGLDDYFMDIPRVKARAALKSMGLPASPEVGILGTMIKKLRAQLESELHIQIANAVLTVTHMIAFYEDDAEDICEYAGVKHVKPEVSDFPAVWETAAVYAGYGFGLCKHYKNEATCLDERRAFPDQPIMAVHYSRAALTMSLPVFYSGTFLSESPMRRKENYSLGADNLSTYSDPKEYWKDVESTLLELLITYPLLDKPEFIIVTGDEMVHGTFMSHLEQAMRGHLGYVPPIYNDDPQAKAAQGAAELRRRASYRKKYPWEDW